MISTLAVLALLIRTVVEGLKGLLPGALDRPATAKALVYVLSAAAVYYFRVDALASVGLTGPVPEWARWALSTLVLAVAAMGSHDLLDALAERR